MPYTQPEAAKIFLFFLEPKLIFPDNVMRQSDAPLRRAASPERLGKNNNGCAFSPFRTQA